MRRKLIFTLLAILLLTPWPVAYAYDNAAAGQEIVQIEPAEPSAAPGWNVYGKAIGGVTRPVDLFYVDTTNNSGDIAVTLYLTNAAELIHYYRYLILNVGVYVQDGTQQWQKATGGDEPLPDTYITMQNGKVNFDLPGYARYKFTIDSGSFYCFNANIDGSSVSPKFYVTVE